MKIYHRTAALSVVSLVIAALALSACGSNGDSTTATPAAGTGGETVMTASVDGAGTVLVDAKGDALYSPSQEANGMIHCTGSCEQIWKPVTAVALRPARRM